MSLTKIGSIGINTGISFAGVTTIATLNASDNVLSVGGTVNFVSDVSIGGTVSIAGTLTYEDVTNVDAVGLITARDGIVVGSGITLSADGDGFYTVVVTATTFSGAFSGDGSALTGVANTDVIFPDKISLGDGSQTDGDQINIGIGSDLRIYHASNVSYMDVTAGGFSLRGTGNDNVLVYTSNSDVEIYHDGSKKFETNSSGVTVTGTVAATAVTGDGSGLTGVGVTVADGGDASYSYTSGGVNYMVHVFRSTTSGVFRTNKDMSIDFLLVGGGGGSATAEGSYGQTGGGGGGGLVEGSGFSLSAGSYLVTVGAGGVASNSTTVGGNGGDTTFAGVTAKGGGGGGDYASNGADGGSGGGGANPNTSGGATNQSSQNGGISDITQFGFAGGQGGNYTSDPRGGGGGGGAGGAGGTASAAGNGVGGARGAGRANSLSGTSITYAIGGRGGKSGRQDAYPGEDGFGHGADGASATAGDEGIGARGGSGIVLIRYEV